MMDVAVHEKVPYVAPLAPLTRQGTTAVVLVALIAAFVFGVHHATSASIVKIWATRDTFAHGFLVLPIVAYFLWRLRTRVTDAPRPFFPALAALALAGGAFLIGERINANSVAQLAMVAMVPLCVWAALGTATVRVFAFPLLFLFFAVPIGDFLVLPMIDWTADFTAFAIRASGVPILREGNIFTIPTGRWSVVEACSGVRYLIASLSVGVLFAYLSYRSWRRRLAFVAASIIVPIVANWLRAYMIVMLGHLSGNRLAVGADHLVYGWVFFGVVIGLLFWIGARWREDGPAQDLPVPEAVRATADRRFATAPLAAALATAAVLVAGSAVLARPAIDAAVSTAPLPTIQPADGWTLADAAPIPWRPDLSGASTEVVRTFVKNGTTVVMRVALYRNQTREAKAVSSTNQIVATTNPRWIQLQSGEAVTAAPAPLHVRSALITNGDTQLNVWHWFWVDGHFVATRYEAALLQALAVLRGRDDSVAWIVISTAASTDARTAAGTLNDFATASAPAIAQALERTIAAP